MPSNRNKARAAIRQLMMDPYAFVGFNGHGVLIGMAVPAWWHDGLTIGDLFFYADKGGLSLLKSYIAWAKDFPGNNEIVLGVTYGGDKGERTEKLYNKLGLTRTGAQYKVEL